MGTPGSPGSSSLSPAPLAGVGSKGLAVSDAYADSGRDPGLVS